MTDPNSTRKPLGSCPCGRGIYGQSECHCAGCGRHFTSPSGFDEHRTGTMDNRGCLDPATILHGPTAQYAGKPKFELRQNVGGPVWGSATYGEHPFAHARDAA